MICDISSKIKAVEHEKHIIHGLNSSVSDSLRGVGHHTQNQRTYTLIWELGA